MDASQMGGPQDTSRAHLRVSVAQICQVIGWNATQTSSIEILTDVLRRYMELLCKTVHNFSEHAGRNQPNLDDLSRAFESVGVSMTELDDYVRHVESVPFAQEQIAFPVARPNNLQFPNLNSREILYHREEHIHDHLPHMFNGMKDDAEQNLSTQALTPQPPAQGNTPADVTTPVAVGEKRTAPTAAETPALSKRPRVTASSLPEEAGHSQYEMSSIILAPDGTFTPARGKGRLPDSCTPPPTIRHALTFTDSTSGANRTVDGSEANKENTVVEPSPKELPVRIGNTTTAKEGSSVSNGSGSKLESVKTKSKKKDKRSIKEADKKHKKVTSSELGANLKLSVGGKQTVSVSSASGSVKKPKIKELKTKEGKSKEGKPAKSVIKLKKKTEPKKKVAAPVQPSVPMGNDGTSESRLKDLLLSETKYNLGDRCEPSTSSANTKQDFSFVHSPDSDLMLRQAFPPTDIFESGSRETSPQRLIIAEAEGRAQESAEEQRVRLKNIEETINDVIRESLASTDSETREQVVEAGKQESSSKSDETSSQKKRGRPKKVKGKDKIKSSEFIAEDVIMQEKEDDLGARNIESINDTINSVIMQGSMKQEPEISPKTSAAEPSKIADQSSKTPVLKKPKKEGKKNKLDKIPGVKKKLKDKLQNKADKVKEPSPPQPPAEIKPFLSDKYSTADMKVFDFGASDSPPALPERRPSQAEKEPSPLPVPAGLPPSHSNFSPVDIKPQIKSPTPETAVTASSASTSSVTSLDQPVVMPLKIGIPKEKKEGHKEKHKDKEHRKDKKEKRRDKEKKKKNKDKDREKDRSRHDKHHHEHKHDKAKVKEETNVTEGSGLKIKIKLGSGPSSSPSMTVSENKPPVESGNRQDLSSPSHRHELKLVIRRDASEGGGKQKHSSSVSKSTPAIKSEPRDTPPTLHPASPLPGTPPPPVLSRNSSPVRERSPSPQPHSPLFAKNEFSRGRSPVRKSPQHQVFTFGSPQHSPPRGRLTVSPPPRTPSPSRDVPSPMPKTPSPQRQQMASSPLFVSSPFQFSPSAGRKSPTPTPKTPSLSPAYPSSSPVPCNQSPVRQKSPDHIKPLFGTPEHETSPPSPLFAADPVENIEPAVKPDPPPVHTKPKGKVGRPRTKSPRSNSPKRKPPKSPKKVDKTGKSPKVGGSGKSPGRGRPPKAKTLALRAALAAEKTSEKESQPKPKPKPKPVPSTPLEIKKDSAAEEKPALSPLRVETARTPRDSSSDSPSPTSLSIAFTPTTSSSKRGAVEAETVGSFIDASTGQQIWICPACKMQDDGSPMIGCDECDDWYHWVCVNITKEPPEEESWFCPRCSARAKQVKPKGKRGRKKKFS